MLAFSSDDLLNLFRAEVVDKVDENTGVDVDCLWSNVEVFSYMTEAIDALAKETEEWQKTFLLPVTAGQQFCPVPQSVHRIRQARLVNKGWYLKPFNINETTQLGFNDYGDLHIGAANVFNTKGDPRNYFLDYKTNQLMLGPIPGDTFIDDNVEILAIVTLAVPMGPGMPLPFRDARDQRCLLNYMKGTAYNKQDADALDLQRANEFMAAYEKYVDKRAYEIKRRRGEAPIVAMDGGSFGGMGGFNSGGLGGDY